MGRGKDVFRTRKQNTSRPPSMHVDDFVTMGNNRVSALLCVHGFNPSPLRLLVVYRKVGCTLQGGVS